MLRMLITYLNRRDHLSSIIAPRKYSVLAYFHRASASKVTAVSSQRRLNRISRLTHWRVLHRVSSYSCSSLAEPGIWGHAYEVNEGGPGFRPSIPFRGSGPARAVACENAQSADLGRRGDLVGAPDDDESTRDGPLKDRDEIVKTRQTRGSSISDLRRPNRQSRKSTN